jgi:hypothetical protein
MHILSTIFLCTLTNNVYSTVKVSRHLLRAELVIIDQLLEEGQWFSLGTPVSSTNKTDRHDIPEIFLKVALNTITLTLSLYLTCFDVYSSYKSVEYS